ncbi:hypothetical protein Acsp04_18280 [Actinomadura sp. NBRC 104425]|nr:hypothetical protein Acsp04_18280 [Actinomadura sp. NBRC 104425]
MEIHMGHTALVVYLAGEESGFRTGAEVLVDGSVTAGIGNT